MGRRLCQTLDAPYFHVITRSDRRMPILIRRTDYRAFVGVLEEGFARYDVRLLAYCVMPSHWHLVLEPAGTRVLAQFMDWVITTHAERWHQHHRTSGDGPVYQRRYYSVPIEAAERLISACRDVERNALAAGLVRRAQDWPWCSLADRLRGAEHLSLKPAPFFTSSAWIEYVNEPGALLAQRPGPTDGDWRDVADIHHPFVPASGTDRRRAHGAGRLALLKNGSDRHLSELPGGFVGVMQRPKNVGGGGARADNHQPDAHVERAKHLLVADSAGALKPREHRRDVPALSIK